MALRIRQEIKEKIARMVKMYAEKTEGDLSEIAREILTKFKIEYEKDRDYNFEDDEEKQSFCFGVLYRQYMTVPAAGDMDIIPLGYETPRTSAKGTFATLFCAFDNGSKDYELINAVLKNRQCDFLENFTMYQRYTVQASMTTNTDTIWIAKDFELDGIQGESLGISPQGVLKKLGIPKVPVTEVWDFLSKTSEYQDKIYAVKTDWRFVKGVVLRNYIGINKNDEEYGMYTIFDPDASDMEQVSEDGRVMGELVIYADPRLTIYPADSLCLFAGTLSRREATEAVGDTPGRPEAVIMNAYSIIPLLIAKDE